MLNNSKTDDIDEITGNIILEYPELMGEKNKLVIYFFYGEGCSHCANQKPFLEQLEQTYPDKIEIKRYETWSNPENAELFRYVASVYEVQIRGVPTTFYR
ncbi:MAG: thioredoxin family protein [Candidatus Nanoarchaeia archaeon]|nr:thioredoxin family protein [Candidatus Nanoarchaeia archaeon]